MANYTYLAGGMKIKAETGFGARHLSPALRSWMVPDPMSEKYYGLSPYSYCGGNPVMFVDPDGEANYFNEKGAFLYYDGVDDGGIRIIEQDDFDEISMNATSPSELDKTLLFTNSVIFSRACQKGILANKEDILSVYQFYNKSDLPLDNGSHGKAEMFYDPDHKGGPAIVINIECNMNTDLFDNGYNIYNAINGHEAFHPASKAFQGITSLSPQQRCEEELLACYNQMNDPSWKKTTKQFKKGILTYLRQNEEELAAAKK